MIWNYHEPIIVYRRFLKPKVYHIIDTKLIKELKQIYKNEQTKLEYIH